MNKKKRDAQAFTALYNAAYQHATEYASKATVSDAMCGFAWVQFPANTKWGRWCKRNNLASPAYPSGLHIWCSEFNQSWARKAAWAGAFAWYLRQHGIECVAGDRLD